MTGSIIFLSIVAVILFILFMPAVVDFRYEENKVNVRVSYCGFTIFDTSKPRKEKDPAKIAEAERKKEIKKQKKEKKKEKKAAIKAEKDKKKGIVKTEKKRSLRDLLKLVTSLLEPVKNGMRRLFKGIRITRFYLDIKVGNFDAYECALAYGKICTAVSNLLAFFQSFFSIKADHIDIQPRFSTEKNVYTVKFRVKLSPSAVLAAGFSLGWTYLMNMLQKQKDEDNMSQKAANQKSTQCSNKMEEIKNGK